MPIYTVVDTVQVEVKYSLYGKFLENVLSFRNVVGEINPVTLENLADALAGWFVASYMPLFSTELTLTEFYIKSLDFDDPYEYTRSISQPGAVAFAALPVNVAAAIHFGTGMIGRSFKGKAYASGVSENKVVGNTFDPVWLASFQLAWEDLPTATMIDEWEHVIVSRQQDLVTINPAVATTVITYTGDPLVRDMGRRLNNS